MDNLEFKREKSSSESSSNEETDNIFVDEVPVKPTV
jgi:hypothetical protein